MGGSENAMVKETRHDTYYNAFLGTGIRSKDPFANTFYSSYPLLADAELAVLYKNALARRIINKPADEAFKRGITIPEDKEKNIIQKLDDLYWEKRFGDALRWSRLFGGSAIFMLINDTKNTDEPLDETKIKNVEELVVYDKREVVTNSLLANKDIYNKNYGKPEFYEIYPAGGTRFIAHHSRMLIFDGETLPRQERLLRNGWGLSELEGVVASIRQNDQTHNISHLIVERLSQPVLSVDELFSKLSTDEGTKDVQNYLHLIDMARHILNTVAIDTKDTFELKNTPITGLPELLTSFGHYLAAITDIPFSILFGRSPSGLQATGQSDLEQYYGMVGRIQTQKIKPNLDRLVKLIQLSRESSFKGKELENWQIKFNSLWVPSQKEQAETKKLNAEALKAEAETYKTLVDIGAVEPEHIRQKLIADGSYPEIESIDDE